MGILTKRARQLLQLMADGEELVWSGRDVWVGLDRTNTAMVYRFMRRMWISLDNTCSYDDDYMIFYISPRGLEVLNK